MVTKSRKESTGAKEGRVKIPKLKLKKETVKDPPDRGLKKIKGGSYIVACQVAYNMTKDAACTARL